MCVLCILYFIFNWWQKDYNDIVCGLTVGADSAAGGGQAHGHTQPTQGYIRPNIDMYIIFRMFSIVVEYQFHDHTPNQHGGKISI